MLYGVGCHHNGCADQNWPTLRALVGDLPSSRSPSKPSPAKNLVALVSDIELFHDKSQAPYASIKEGPVHKTMALQSQGFAMWFRHRLWEQEETTASDQVIKEAISLLQARAIYDGVEYPVGLRVAEHEGSLYLDLVNEQWQAVRITPNNWEIVAESLVRFYRRPGMLPLPMPQRGGNLAEFRSLVNIHDVTAWTLVLAYLLAMLHPDRPFPVLVVTGEQGSAKSGLSQSCSALPLLVLKLALKHT